MYPLRHVSGRVDKILGIFSKKLAHRLVFGPNAIKALSARAHIFVNALGPHRVYIDQQGRWQDEEIPAYWHFAFFVVALKIALGDECLVHIQKRSGLPFEQFVGQIIMWWLPQRNRIGLLRAVSHRLDAHGVSLTLPWNQSRALVPHFVRPPFSTQIFATLAGFAVGLFMYYQFNWDQVFGFLCAAAGYVWSELYRRSTYHAYCSDGLCRSRVRSSTCEFCGAEMLGPSK